MMNTDGMLNIKCVKALMTTNNKAVFWSGSAINHSSPPVEEDLDGR